MSISVDFFWLFSSNFFLIKTSHYTFYRSGFLTFSVSQRPYWGISASGGNPSW